MLRNQFQHIILLIIILVEIGGDVDKWKYE